MMILKNKNNDIFYIKKKEYKKLSKQTKKSLKKYKTKDIKKTISFFNIPKYQTKKENKILEIGATKELSGWDSINKIKDQISNTSKIPMEDENKVYVKEKEKLKFKNIKKGDKLKLILPFVYLTEFKTYKVIDKNKEAFWIENDNGIKHIMKKSRIDNDQIWDWA
jgi:hypothetical protein